MQRRIFLKNTGITLGALAILKQSALAQLLTDPAWKIKMLTDDIGIFTEKGGTIVFMLSKEGVVVVDSQFPDAAGHLIDELKNRSAKPFRLLVNTHHHGDHTAGNIAFKGLVPHVLAHANCKKNLEAVAVKQNSTDKQLFPDQTYTNTWEEKIGNEKLKLHYYGAGHTDGDSLVHFQKNNVVHMGDLVFNRRHPYVDKTAGANMANWIQVLDKTIKTFDKKTIFVSGHSGNGYDVILNISDIVAFQDYLGNVLRFTEGALKAGQPKEDILKASEIPGSPQWKGDGIQRPLSAAIEELSAKMK